VYLPVPGKHLRRQEAQAGLDPWWREGPGPLFFMRSKFGFSLQPWFTDCFQNNAVCWRYVQCK
jgi:hypothetical protein